MAFRLKPHEDAFFDLIGEAGDNLQAAADVLVGLRQPGVDRAAVAAAMRDCEHRGDEVTHRVLRLLNKSFITPFDREDIYRLAGRIDDVVDALEEATDFLGLTDPGPLPDLMHAQIEVLERGCRLTGNAMRRLATPADLESYWIEVNSLENEADDLYRRLLGRLYGGEYEIMRMLKLREVAELFESAADALEHVAHAVETIAVKDHDRAPVLPVGPDRVRSPMSLTMLAVLIIAVGLTFDYTNGFHDSANAIATSVSTRALSPQLALAMAAVLNVAGALVSTKVAATVGGGIIDAPVGRNGLLVVLAALLGAIGWNLLTWWFGLPSSSSHALVGGLVGAALVSSAPCSGTASWAKS